MRVEIITPDTKLFEGEADLVQLPGIDGSFEVLNNHAPMISVLAKGRIKLVDSSKKEEFIDIKGGVIEVLKNRILILAE
jgi:F-type H+-transporting ATPase subunit epsilon